jgi:cytochrome b involved in lipid metabolism
MTSLSTSASDGMPPPALAPRVRVSRARMPRSAGVASAASRSGAGGSASDTTRPGKRKKVRLAPGFSQMDWIRLNARATDMNGLAGAAPRAITRKELRKHRSRYDCWMALRGKVFNVTKYLSYHPGGPEELMSVAGKDATREFDKIHKWVSIDGFLAKCYVGDLVVSGSGGGGDGGGDEDEESAESNHGGGSSSSSNGRKSAGASAELEQEEEEEQQQQQQQQEVSWGDLDGLL